MVSLIFLSYLHTYLLRHKTADSSPKSSSSTRNIQLLSNNQVERRSSTDKHVFGREGSINSAQPVPVLPVNKEYQRPASPVSELPAELDEGTVMPPVSYTSGGVNFYLRLGAIGKFCYRYHPSKLSLMRIYIMYVYYDH